MNPYRSLRRPTPLAIALTFSSLVTLTAQSQTEDGWVLALPKRRTASPVPATLPELPPAARAIAQATIRLAVQDSAPRKKPEQQTITRTAGRIHVAREDGREWFFERNPIDPRRVSAAAVEHASREVVLYAETDLRMMMGIRGWADVLTLGFDPDRLAHYEPTAKTRTIDGVRFTRYVSTNGGPGSEADIWWNGEQQLASGFTISDRTGTSRFVVESISPRVEAESLQPPSKRYPNYTVINVADWLEQH